MKTSGNLKIDISIGEAIDRLTILKIKISKIKEYEKLKNIRYEHDLLEKSIYLHNPKIKIFPLKVSSPLYGELYRVNSELWRVEDKLRDLERTKDFGKLFIRYARKVYLLNDKRASIKYKINKKFKSKIVEEKSYEKY